MAFVGCCDHKEAERLGIKQLGASACGATALYTALLMLKVADEDMVHNLDWSLATVRSRAYNAPLPQYLLSRHNAGCTGDELISSMKTILAHSNLSEHVICEDFVPFHVLKQPIVDYFADILTQGYIVIATFNLQILGNDAWHHQVVYGVDTDQRLLFCTNPLGPYDEDLATAFLSTHSVLVVRKEDITTRYHREGGDYSIYNLPLWQRMEVQKQVEEVVQEGSLRDFVMIPAAYVAGFALFKKASIS
ncbi:hypothetical protein EON65_22355 [archaeon]|nr:MAG: hypothetical protein EON65_22355 [archaeon]